MSVPEPDLQAGYSSLEIYDNPSKACDALGRIPHAFREPGMTVQSYGGGYAVMSPRGHAVSADELLRKEFGRFADQFGKDSGQYYVKQRWTESRQADGLPVPEGW